AATLTLYQLVLITGFFACLLPFGATWPTSGDASLMLINGLTNGIGQYWWTRSLSLAPASAVTPFYYLMLVWPPSSASWCGVMSRPWRLWSARRSSWGPASIFCGTRPDARRLRGLPEVARHDRSAWLGNVAFADTDHRTRLDQDRHDPV